MAKNDFQYGGWNSYTLQCGTIVTLIAAGSSIEAVRCFVFVVNYSELQ